MGTLFKLGAITCRPQADLSAQQVFFLIAAVFAAIAPWLLLISLSGKFGVIVDISTHAQGMLFGYVGALLAGYLVGKQSSGDMLALVALWLAGRLAEVLSENGFLTNGLYITYGIALAWTIAPQFNAAKKRRNRLIAPLLVLVTCFPAIYWLLSALGLPVIVSLRGLILLIALLLFFMGGRFITPVLARSLAQKGQKLQHRVQPRIEGSVMVLLLIASGLSVLQAPDQWVALLAAMASVLTLTRVIRWRLFRLNWRHADLWALGVGYLWLAIGLMVFGISLAGGLPVTASLHVITIGALGTLSSTIMLKLSTRHIVMNARVYYWVVIMIGLAAINRFLSAFIPVYREIPLVIASVMWSVNFMVIAYFTCIGNRGDVQVRSRQCRLDAVTNVSAEAASRE